MCVLQAAWKREPSGKKKPIQTLSPSDPEPPNGWINKSPFRIVFGEGIVARRAAAGPVAAAEESPLCAAHQADMKSRCPCLLQT